MLKWLHARRPKDFAGSLGCQKFGRSTFAVHNFRFWRSFYSLPIPHRLWIAQDLRVGSCKWFEVSKVWEAYPALDAVSPGDPNYQWVIKRKCHSLINLQVSVLSTSKCWPNWRASIRWWRLFWRWVRPSSPPCRWSYTASSVSWSWPLGWTDWTQTCKTYQQAEGNLSNTLPFETDTDYRHLVRMQHAV